MLYTTKYYDCNKSRNSWHGGGKNVNMHVDSSNPLNQRTFHSYMRIRNVQSDL